jgi:mannose-6-phosphate isomerase
MHRVEKPWGHEIIWAHTKAYVGKTLHINAGHSLSRQYHRVKDETLLIVSGVLDVEIGSGEKLRRFRLYPQETLHITPGTIHRLSAQIDTEVTEVSTPELDDVVRLEDRYGRVLPEEKLAAE